MSFFIIPIVAAGCLVDIKKGIIPKWCTVPVFILGLIHNIVHLGWNGIIESFLGALGVVMVYLSMNRVLNIGFGDIKLLMGAGAYAGIRGMPVLLIIMLTLSSLMMLVRFIKINKTYTPLSFYRAAVNQLRAGVGGERVAFAPYIGGPFIIFLIVQEILRGGMI
jgi:prepilin signal peptidase PulO-like enzyme (type II secretory pathway)